MAQILRRFQPAVLASPLPDQRAALEAAAAASPVPDDLEVVEVELGGVPAERVAAAGADKERVVVHFHGGGYVIGSAASHRDLAARLSRASGATVVVPSYRLAPEHRFPAAADDALSVYRAVLDQAQSARSLAVTGDSAGGGLVLSTLVAARTEGLDLPAAAVCWSPWLDLAASLAAAEEAGYDGSAGEPPAVDVEDPVVNVQWLASAASHYLGDADPADPAASPLYADLAGLPPMLVVVGSVELMRPQALRLVEQAAAAGVEVETAEFTGAFHWWMVLAPDAPESDAALSRVGRFISSMTAS
jgi:epsilon-lactone hydrolase